MKLKLLLKQMAPIMALAGSVLLLSLLFFFIPKKTTQSNLAITTTTDSFVNNEEETSYGLPARLRIPSIDIDTSLKPVGRTSDGAMDKPKSPNEVVWFEPGKRPGEIGSAVIAGHYGIWKNGQGSIFDDLHELRKGDKISIEDEKGTVIPFVVRESRSYDPDANASDVFSSNDGKSHLNLVTCEGVWNKSSKSYSKRLVIFADKE